MFKWFYKLQKALKEKLSEKGQGMVEYALVLAAVAIIAFIVLRDNESGLTKSVSDAYNNASTQIDKATKNDDGTTK